MRTGEQLASVVQHKLNWSGAGTLGVRVLFQVDGPENETIWGDIWLSEKSMAIARKSLKAIGFDPDIEKDLEILTLEPTRLCGKQARITVEEEEYRGKTSLKVKWINPVDTRPAGDVRTRLTSALDGLRKAKKSEEDLPLGSDIPF